MFTDAHPVFEAMTATDTDIEKPKGRKHDQVIAGAQQVFMEQGFEGASVDDIARVANVSKATLYSYFPDKRLLFIAVLKEECARQAQLTFAVDDSVKPSAALLQEAKRFVRFLASPIALNMFRVVIAESQRFPEIGHEFYKSGPGRSRRRMIDYFEAAIERGELAIDVCAVAADQFAELCKSDCFYRIMLNMNDGMTEAEMDQVATEAVTTFLARYGTPLS
jgi:TetR/AcrR family transcriptional repressor of mexJK operon